MEPIKENQNAGYYRLRIYEAIADTLKRELTENEHKYLSTILKLYGNSHAVIQKTIVAQAPQEHKWVCVKCAETESVNGPKENKKMRSEAKKNKINLP